jgi:site-specific DNA-adenine methylase
MSNLRPFFTFYGGKWRAAPFYDAPTHGHIVEPFAGSARAR